MAVASSHLAAETVLLLDDKARETAELPRITADDIQQHSEQPVTGPWSPAESRLAAAARHGGRAVVQLSRSTRCPPPSSP